MYLLNSKDPHKTCKQGSSGQWQLCLGLTPEAAPKAPCALTPQRVDSSPAWARIYPVTSLGRQGSRRGSPGAVSGLGPSLFHLLIYSPQLE